MPDRKYPWQHQEYSEVAKKYSEYGGYPESQEGQAGRGIVKNEGNIPQDVQGGDKFFKDWYDHPETRDKLQRQLGLDDKQIDQAISHALSAETQEVYPEQLSGIGAYDAGAHKITTTKDELGRGALPHERAHATQLDGALGEILQQNIGKPREGSSFKGYLSNPNELYGNFVDLRSLLKLEPGDWVTPELIESRLESLGIDESHPRRAEFDQMLDAYSIEQLAEGLDKIASVEADAERLERLNFTPSDFVISRPNTLYT